MWRSKSWIFEIFSKIWMSKSLNATQIQDWGQIMVFEMVYLLVQQVFEKTTIIRGTQILAFHAFCFSNKYATLVLLSVFVKVYSKIIANLTKHTTQYTSKHKSYSFRKLICSIGDYNKNHMQYHEHPEQIVEIMKPTPTIVHLLFRFKRLCLCVSVMHGCSRLFRI